MKKLPGCVLFLAALTMCLPALAAAATAARGLDRVGHIIVLMQENHSFDNYFGALPYDAHSPYHPPSRPGGPCRPGDHRCVDGLTCRVSAAGALDCTNSNPGVGGGPPVRVFHETRDCTANPHHGWVVSHRDANFANPNSSTMLNNGFVRTNSRDPHHTVMGYYTRAELPYYYALAETFAISDRYFCPVTGPTLPNRMYLMGATSFGHVLTSSLDDTPPTRAGYRPITGTIFDLLDARHVPWTEYYELPNDHLTPPRPYGALFNDPHSPHFKPVAAYYRDVAAGRLAPVVFIDLRQHEHPPLDVRAGEFEVARVIAALRRSPEWKNSILLLTYDENGGFYDHVAPPAAPNPDGIPPGACADLSNRPASMVAGGGANCEENRAAQRRLCAMTRPRELCADFTHLGFRVPLLAVSPFARPHYVSHVTTDHDSIPKLIEDRFLGGERLTARDATAGSLDGLFDFRHAPSLDAQLPAAPAPSARDPGCG